MKPLLTNDYMFHPGIYQMPLSELFDAAHVPEGYGDMLDMLVILWQLLFFRATPPLPAHIVTTLDSWY